MARDYTKYLTWLRNEFRPLTLATPEDTLKQIVENSIRFWNTNSAYKVGTMVPYIVGQKRAQLNPQVKTVVDIYPDKTTTWIWNDHERAWPCRVAGIENPVNCGDIRVSQNTISVIMSGCGQSATKPFAIAA